MLTFQSLSHMFLCVHKACLSHFLDHNLNEGPEDPYAFSVTRIFILQAPNNVLKTRDIMEMMTEAHLQTVMGIIGYTFQFENYLSLALTAAGAEDDNYDGNRGLAQVGTSLIEFLLVFKGYDAKSVRSKVQKDFRAQYSNNNHCAMLARRTGIDRCIKYNPRSGRGSKKVEARAMNAIIAAVYLDCMDTTTVQEVMQRIGLVCNYSDTRIG